MYLGTLARFYVRVGMQKRPFFVCAVNILPHLTPPISKACECVCVCVRLSERIRFYIMYTAEVLMHLAALVCV